MGAAGKYAVLSLAGTYQNQSLVTINGDVGIGPNGTALTQSGSTVDGHVFKDPTATYSNNGTVTGMVLKDMSQEVTDATNASNYYKNLAGGGSTLFSSITQATTINSRTIAPTIVGENNFYVFTLGGTAGINLNNVNLTISGGANDYFVFNIYGGFSLAGNASIVLQQFTTAGHVLFNVLGTGSTLTTGVSNTVRGTVLAVSRSITFDGVFVGQIIGGGSNLTLMSGTQVQSPTSTVPDSGSTLALALAAFSILVCGRAFLRRKTAAFSRSA